jgi:ribose/xylose/arabinose/galactoside ABC-type transport system permease subunit
VPGPPPPRPTIRDLLAVNLVWEGILLVITVGLVVATLASAPVVHLDGIISPIGYSGLVAAGLALSLRTGTPNLAVGSIAGFAGVVFAHLATDDRWSWWAATIAVVAISAVIGLMTGLIVAGLSVPAWAVTIAATVLLQSAAFGVSNSAPVTLHLTGPYPTTIWVTVFAVISIGGGALWLVPALRTALSATRSAGEPGRWAGLPAGLGAVVGLTGSSALAGAAGVSLAIYTGVGDPEGGGISLTLVALAAVLVGGVSIFGRRAGIFGTALGILLVQTVLFLLNLHAVSPYWVEVPIGGLALLGLGVSRGIESISDALRPQVNPGPVPPAGLGVAGPVRPPGPNPR